jgi:hypothetical protein
MNEIKNVIIDSRLRDSGNESNFSYTLKWPIADPLSYAVESVQLYNTSYTINNYNNKLYWTDSTPTAHTTTLTNGNYTASSLATHVTTLMNADNTGGGTYTVTTDISTGKITIANSSSNFSLTFGTNTSNSVATALGFANANKTGSSSYTGEKIVKLNTKYYVIYGDIGSQNSYSANELVNVLAYVPNSVNFGDMINYQSELAKSFKLTEKEISRMKIFVKDDTGNIVDLNGVDWSMNIIVSLK